MASRSHRIGNIYTRIAGLIEKGAMNVADKPVWFDVYARFPPKYEPVASRRPPDVEVRNIFYPEDIVRAKIQKAFGRDLGYEKLNVEVKPRLQTFVEHYNSLISQGKSEEEAINELRKKILEERSSKSEKLLPPEKTEST